MPKHQHRDGRKRGEQLPAKPFVLWIRDELAKWDYVIREARTFMLPGIIQTGKKQGMQLMDDALVELQSLDLIAADEACARADQKQEMRSRLKT